MDGTAFFPQNVDGTSKLVQCIQSELPVFSRDCGEGGEKSFFACGYLHFVDVLYRKKHMRHTYEVLQWADRPTKLFFDFDHFIVSGEDTVDFERLVQRFLEHVSKDITERFNYDVPPEMIILDASTDKKKSRHVIYQFYLTDMQAVKDYYEHLMGSFSFSTPEEAKVVDPGVYTRNRSFRLIYSSKYGKKNVLQVVGRDSADQYNPTDVIKSMIQVRAAPHYRGPYKALLTPTVHHFKAGAASRKRPRGDSPRGDCRYVPPENLPAGVLDYIKDQGGVVRTGHQDGDKFMSFIVGGLRCPWVQRVHKSNNTYFTISLTTGMSWFRCADSDCPNMHYSKVKLNWAYS